MNYSILMVDHQNKFNRIHSIYIKLIQFFRYSLKIIQLFDIKVDKVLNMLYIISLFYMAFIYPEPSRTFSEFLLIPGLSTRDCVPSNVNLETPLVKFKKGEESPIKLKIPLVSAIMQAVSGEQMAVALAREGGLSFIFGSQPIQSQAAMVRNVKNFKAGFVVSDSNIKPDQTFGELLELSRKTGHDTVAVTDDGTSHGVLLGIVTSRDYPFDKSNLSLKVSEIMTPFDKLTTGHLNIKLSEANKLIWENKINQLPIIDDDRHLYYIVFRKDYDSSKANVNQLVDSQKRYLVGAGINTRDYEQRVPALVEAGADVLCIDSSDGFSEWQKITIGWIKEKYGDKVKVGAGNIVDAEGFKYLAEAGADFIKIGIGGGSICITREQKGIGRGQASAVLDVSRARNEYFQQTGVYIPICSDGGIVYDYHIALALAMGADFIMLGRYFARFDESPSRKVTVQGTVMKEYWGEGSSRARNWQRYDLGGDKKISFEEGVDSYVPYAGKLSDNVNQTLTKVKSTMCNCGSINIPDFQKRAKLTIVSQVTVVESGAHDVVVKTGTADLHPK